MWDAKEDEESRMDPVLLAPLQKEWSYHWRRWKRFLVEQVCGRRLGFQWGMLSVTSKWSCSLGKGWIYETGGQMRAPGVINIQVVFKDLKLDEVNNGLSETEKRRGPGTEPWGPSTLTSPETRRNQQKILKKSHQWVAGELGKYSKTVFHFNGHMRREYSFLH